ncbi:MAG TPA: ABC transporter permease [Flavisolibacter sp.]|nr:ABC transporter permease [Flavisolibacter sp.]
MNIDSTMHVESANPAQENWTEIIKPKSHLFDLRLHELWRYRDLVAMFVRRDFVSNYKQTILGPIWFFIQPLITTIMFVFVFGKIAGFAPAGVPMLAFYMAGVTIWNFFSENLNRTSTVFRDNAGIFGKVYFPRLTMPIAIVISSLVRFAIQFFLFLLIWGYYMVTEDSINPNWWAILLTPLLLLIMGLLALGLGMIITAMTTKYRDLVFLMGFGVQLLMYATPVIYPLEKLPVKYAAIIKANPMSPVLETFRFAFLGSGDFSWSYLLYSVGITLAILSFGIVVFNRVEKSFTDTV